jgi:hypothetical protein
MDNWQWTNGKIIATGIFFSAILYVLKEKEINEAVQRITQWFREKEERKEVLVAVIKMIKSDISDHFFKKNK